MIPVTLTIQGMYSYRNKQTIDFTKLTQAGLFGIFGGVGCGKSTILEAITFALYGESERLNKGDNRNYNMMNLKSNELLIDFEFKTSDENHYRFVVKAKRNGKNFEEVKKYERTAYKKQDDDWEPIECSQVEAITGLNYKNFRRTVIIPQGKFQEFLQLSTNDRTEMLKELFNLNKYDLYSKVAGIEARNNEKIQNLNGQIQSIGEINPEEIAVKEKLLEEMRTQTVKLNEESSLQQKQMQEFEQLKGLTLNLEQYNQHLSELQKQEPDINRQEQELKEYEKFSLEFKSDLDQLNILDASRIKTTEDIEASKQKLLVVNETIKKSEIDFNQTRIAFEQKEKLNQESEELRKLISIRNLETDRNEKQERLSKGRDLIEGMGLSIYSDKQSLGDLKIKVEHLQKELPDLALLSLIKDWFTNRNNYIANRNEYKKKISGLTQALLAKNQEACHSVLSLSEDADRLSFGEINSLLDEEKKSLEKRSKELDSEVLHLEIQNRLEEFANGLTEGQPCPLCGSDHHPNVLNAQNLTERLAKSRGLQQEVRLRAKQILDLEKAFTQYVIQAASIEDQIKTENIRLKESDEKIRAHETKFVWPGFSMDNEEQLSNEYKKAEVLKQELEKANQELNVLSRKIETDEKNREKYSKAIEDLDKDCIALQTQSALLTDQLTIVKVDDFHETPSADLKMRADDLTLRYKLLVEKYHKEEKILSDLRTNAGTLTGSIETNQNALQNILTKKDRLNESINRKLLESGIVSKEYVERTLAKQLDIAGLRKMIETFRRDYETTRKYISELECELKGRKYDELKHREVKVSLDLLSQKIESFNQQIGSLQNEVQRLKSDLERYLTLRTELDKLNLRAQDIVELKNLFRANAFVNYISTVYLRNLCKTANERFYKLTRQKLNLELTEDNGFQVRDFMNEGKVRSVKTLSGGQTFQASLSLALSLADSIHKVSPGYENFFFLDEGFGTLDKDSLDIVFETLKSLKKEN
ncbi:MAG: SbcC/MukB-like Walker B domain-containing protein, partial [Bacteroidota bacterium]|nr:SbcC/MukB-like Walker B domain-containing protein [Bacteroidota bacterium]